jgi:hypothetical protein
LDSPGNSGCRRFTLADLPARLAQEICVHNRALPACSFRKNQAPAQSWETVEACITKAIECYAADTGVDPDSPKQTGS